MSAQIKDLSIQNLQAGYSSGWFGSNNLNLVVDGFNLNIPAGSIIALVGGNGTGKSTIIRAVVDPSFRTNGTIFSGNDEVKFGEFGYVPQQSTLTLLPWRTGFENVAFWKEIHGYNRKKRLADAKRISEELELKVTLDRPVFNLSGGERVKIALLRSLAVDNMKAWILDEPFEGLDLKSRLLLRSLIQKIADKGIPVLITSHRSDDLSAIGAKEYSLIGKPVSHAKPVEEIHQHDKEEHKITDIVNILSSSTTLPEKVFVRGKKEFPLGLIGVVVGILIWSVIAWLIEKPSLLPSPLAVIKQFKVVITTKEMYFPLLYTLLRAIGSWGIGISLALPLGILIGYYTKIYRLVSPWLVLARAMPVFALIGISIGLFSGFSEVQRIFLISLTIFTIFLQLISASAFIAPRRRVEIARIYGASQWFCLSKIMFYEVMPGILGGLEVTLPLALVVTLVVETFLLPPVGLGNYIINKISDPDSSMMLAYLLPPAVLAASSVWLIRRYFDRRRYEI